MAENYGNDLFGTTLGGPIDASAVSFTVADVSHHPAPVYRILIDEGTGRDELCRVDNRGGLTLAVTRGVGGYPAQAHPANATVRVVATKETLDALVTGGGAMANPMTTAGDLIRGGTSGAPARLPIGANGLWLTVAGGQPTWQDLPAAVGFANPMTAPGDLIVGGAAGAAARLAKGADGQVFSMDPVTHAPIWANNPAGFADPLTSKGDLIVRGNTGTTRLPAGANDLVLTTDSAQALGVKWAAPAAGGGGAGTVGLPDPTTTKGDLIVRGSQGTDRALGVIATSNEGTSNSFARLTDGDDATRFDGNGVAIPSSYFLFDLGAAYAINQWRIKQMLPADQWFAAQYTWQYSTDNVTFADADTHVAVAADETVNMASAHTARYWKLVLQSAPNNPAAAWLAYTVSLFQAVTPTRLGVGTVGQRLTADPAQALGVGWKDELQTLNVVIDGGGAVIAAGQKGHLQVDYACVIQSVTLLADQSGSLVVDIWKDAYANFPPTAADSIAAAAKPTLAGAQKAQDATLTGWTTAIAAGDVLAFNVDSAAAVQRATLALKVRRA